MKKTGSAALKAENERLRATIEQQSQAQAALAARLAVVAPKAQATGGELMVGIRNISDNTIGIRSPFPNEPDLHLHADVGDAPDPNRTAVISHAWWQRLRKSEFMARGMIMRDDNVLGNSYQAAPEDRPEDVHPTWGINVVMNPVEWIESRTEKQIRAELKKMTSKDSLQRLRRAVDDKLRVLEAGFKKDGVENPAKEAVSALPSLYRLVDDLTTELIEA